MILFPAIRRGISFAATSVAYFFSSHSNRFSISQREYQQDVVPAGDRCNVDPLLRIQRVGQAAGQAEQRGRRREGECEGDIEDQPGRLY